MTDRLYSTCFLTYRRPHCVYDWQLRDKNLRFIAGIDFDYFTYIATRHADDLEGLEKQRAATALRIAYHHAIETFLTVMGSAIQSPDCVFGWALKCKTDELRSLISDVTANRTHVFNELALSSVTWAEVARVIFEPCPANAKADIVKSFGAFWNRLAQEFLTEAHQQEYNSLKHGFRIKPGGFSLSYGEEEQPGIPAAPEKMKLLGACEFGSSFLVATPPLGRVCKKGEPSFYTRFNALNWNPESLRWALELIGMSIQNVVAFLRRVNGDTLPLQFVLPDDPSDFAKPWANGPSVLKMSFDVDVRDECVEPLTNETIFERLRESKWCRNVPGVPTGTKTGAAESPSPVEGSDPVRAR
jgi:hypothetical protein